MKKVIERKVKVTYDVTRVTAAEAKVLHKLRPPCASCGEAEEELDDVNDYADHSWVQQVDAVEGPRLFCSCCVQDDEHF